MPTAGTEIVEPVAIKVPAVRCIGLRIEGPAAPRVRLLQRRAKVWGPFFPPPPTAKGDIELGVVGVGGMGERNFVLRGVGWQQSGLIAPVLLASSLDPVTDVLVVRNRLTLPFMETLARLLSTCEGKPKLRFVPQGDDSGDLWIQDAVEFGVSSAPDSRGRGRQTVTALLGLRAKHDMGLECAPLDFGVSNYVERELPEVVPVTIGEPRPKRRWIDWYGNLEVSPPVPGFPYGRVLTGEQKGLRIHPDLLTFLDQQNLQWPALFLDTSWLTIGHVDEIINFVPAKNGKGFRALLPSPTLARTILEGAIRDGKGDTPVFAGTPKATTAMRLLEEVAKSPETDEIIKALTTMRAQLKDGLGLEADDIVEVPALFKEGAAVIPNGVNSLVIGRDVIIPDPLGPKVNGEDLFQKAIQTRLAPLDLRLTFINVWEPYHSRSGEIHCATNTIRRLRKVDWWKGEKG